MKRWILNLTLAIMSVFVTLAVLEVSVRVMYRGVKTNLYEFRESRPAPYQHSPYFSPEFLKEAFFQPGGWTVPPHSRLIIPNDFHGKYFNVSGGIRHTTDNPERYRNTVYVFGGSTVYSSEVPDEYTIPSIIQRLLNEMLPNRYRVLNYGTTSVNTYQQVERLKTVMLRKGDVVIFYCGANDALLLTTGRPNGWILGENHIEYEKLSVLQKITFWIYNKYNSKSKLVSVFFYPYSNHIPQHLSDELQVARLQDQLRESYVRNLRNAETICRKSGALFYNFLQPTIVTRNPNTDYEKTALLSNAFVISPVWRLACEKSYTVLKQCEKDVRAIGIPSVDLTAVFDALPDDFYIDIVHLTDTGNRVIVKEIFKNVFHRVNVK